MATAVGGPGEGYYGAGGRIFQSSALADASFGMPQQQRIISAATGGAVGGVGQGGGIEGLIAQYQKVETESRAKSLEQLETARGLRQQILDIYAPGGAFGKGWEMMLQQQKVKDVSATAQRDISRGMYGIRPYEQEWETGVGAPARLRLEDIRLERRAGALAGMAGMEERVEYPYPDYRALMQAAQASAATPGISTGGYGAYGGAGGGYQPAEAAETARAAPVSEPWTGGTGPTPGGGVSIPMGKGYGPMFGDTGGSVSVTIYAANYAVTGVPSGTPKTIKVAASDRGGGPGGFVSEAKYKAIMPPGYTTQKPVKATGGGGAAAAYRPQTGYGTF